MVRKFTFVFALLVLTALFTGASFATVISTQITFGPNTTGSITLTTTAAIFSPGMQGLAWQQGQPQGDFLLSGGSLSFANTTNPYTFGPNSQTFTVNIGTDTMVGLLNVQALFVGGPYGFFAAKYDITSSTWGFAQTGFAAGSIVDIDFVTYNGHLSSGEVVPSPVPEPGTIAMVGSGLLAVAGMLRRKL